MPLGYAELTGTARQPELRLSFTPYLPHPTIRKMTLLDWVKSLPGRRFDPDTKTWIVTGIGPDPDRVIADAGIEVIYPTEGELAGTTHLAQLYAPVTMLAGNGRTVLMRHRFAGYDEAVKLVGPGATWDKKRGLFKVPVADVLAGGSVRPGVIWDPKAVERAAEVHAARPGVPGIEVAARKLAAAVNADDVADDIAAVRAHLSLTGEPDSRLFGYQQAGHLAVAAGHRGLFDEPGVGKTTQFLTAAHAMGAERTLVICPPLVLTNWARETVMAGLAAEDAIAVFRAGRKEPSLDGVRVAIIADSLLASRPATAVRIAEWKPDVLGYDEAHRAKTFGSKRSEAILDLAAAIPGVKAVAITGTPMFAGPHELVPLLDLTGHLAPVFGGHAAFLTRYCRQDKFGGWHARKEHLAELRQMLREHVAVRRTKEQVLPDLPAKLPATERVLDIDLAPYRQAHKDVTEKIHEWLTRFSLEHGRLPQHADPDVPGSPDEIVEYAQESIRYVSLLRKAAGLAKVPAAAEYIQSFVEGTRELGAGGQVTYPRPLIVWAHHLDVVEVLTAAVTELVGTAHAITGATSDQERTRIVDAFQAGQIPVLIGGITAAGVGITLTRSSDVLFVETDWTPALVAQAIDRAHRYGQTRQVAVETLIAPGTLDEHIQKVLLSKGQVLSEAMGDTAGNVAVTRTASEDLTTASELMILLIDDAIASYKPGKG